MANENVKIVIEEDNQTSPRGAGASSDIAYVPGLAISEALYKNRPILCNSVAEFKQYFGEVPYEMTDVDVDNTQYPHTYSVGDYDKSYIYAKELINNGISVIYENICVEEGAPNLAKMTLKTAGVGIKDNRDNSYTYDCVASDTPDSIILAFNLKGQDPTSGSVTVLFDGDSSIFTGYTITSPSTVEGLTINNVNHTIVWSGIPENTFKHCKDPNANMILECDLEITAQKICELLNIEEYIKEASQELQEGLKYEGWFREVTL